MWSLHNFEPAVRSGQWQVSELRPAPPAHTHTHSYSVSHMSTQAPFLQAKWIHSPYGSLQKYFSSVYSVRFAQKGLSSAFLWSLVLGSWTRNAWPQKEHWCCQAKHAREGGPKMQPVNPCWVRITSCTAFKTKCTVSLGRIPLTLHIPSSLECLQTGNLLTVWKLIIRQLIQLSSTGIINSIYLPVISNNSCLERTKQNMID